MANPCKKRRFVSHGGDVWGFSRRHGVPLEKVLDFSGPINFLGPSPKAVEAVKNYARLIRFYPDPNPVDVKAAIAKYVGHNVDESNIILGNGSIELIYIIAEVFPSSFEAVVPVPSFTEYEKAVLRVHGKPVFVQLPEDFALETERIKKAVTGDTRMVCICNPHSPSGRLFDKEAVLDLVEFCHAKGVLVSIDENYIEFSERCNEATMAGYIRKHENLFVIRSVTKFFGMPGIRFGYGIVAESMKDELEAVRQPWSINTLAGYATLAAFEDTEFITRTKKIIAAEKAQFAKMLNEIGRLHVFSSETNFLLVKILDKIATSTSLRERLAEDGILIRDCSTFVGLDDSYFRVTVRSKDENAKLIAAVRRILA